MDDKEFDIEEFKKSTLESARKTKQATAELDKILGRPEMQALKTDVINKMALFSLIANSDIDPSWLKYCIDNK